MLLLFAEMFGLLAELFGWKSDSWLVNAGFLSTNFLEAVRFKAFMLRATIFGISSGAWDTNRGCPTQFFSKNSTFSYCWCPQKANFKFFQICALKTNLGAYLHGELAWIEARLTSDVSIHCSRWICFVLENKIRKTGFDVKKAFIRATQLRAYLNQKPLEAPESFFDVHEIRQTTNAFSQRTFISSIDFPHTFIQYKAYLRC